VKKKKKYTALKDTKKENTYMVVVNPSCVLMLCRPQIFDGLP
jgi:hypothetical protein